MSGWLGHTSESDVGRLTRLPEPLPTAQMRAFAARLIGAAEPTRTHSGSTPRDTASPGTVSAVSAIRRRVVVLTNPAAGHGKGKSAADAVLQLLKVRGVQVEHVTGTSRDDAEARLHAAMRGMPEAIISIGGDGTHGIAIQAAAASGLPLAIVPAGTGNDLARMIGVPTKPVERAVELALTGQAAAYDLGKVTNASGGSRYFVTIVTAGFDSLVTDRNNAMRWPNGRARYVLAIGMEYVRLKPRQFQLKIDDEIINEPLILAAIGNTSSYGGGMHICPDADPHDGLLDITVIRAVPHPRLELPMILPKVYPGKHVSHPAVTTYRAKHVEVTTPHMNAYADGDLAGELPVTIDSVPNGLQLITPGTGTL